MAESEREIQVRTLSGESTTISVSPSHTILDLKHLLKQAFLPAKKFPNFHLFFKSAKMSPENTISSYSINANDFLVFIPFTKKDKNRTQSQPSSTSAVSSSFATSANSAWSDLMQDLSSLPNLLGEEEQVVPNSLIRKKKSRSEEQDELLRDVFESGGKDVVDERIGKVTDMAECLCDRKTGKCLLSGRGVKSCCCPAWLKTILKTFSFLNIFSGFFETQGLDVTWRGLEGAMKKIGVGVEDVERLSVLCPEIVKLGNPAIEVGESVNAIVIFDYPAEEGDYLELINALRIGRKQTSTSTIINTIKKRYLTFKSNLSGAVRELMDKCKPGNRMHMLLTLEDLLIFMKDHGMQKGGEAKRAKTNGSVTSNSGQNICCDTNSLVPLEMIKHLREGIGSYGQIVHVEEISARMAVHAEIPDEISEITRSALKRIGVSRLYSHQAESIQASLSGKSVVVATMTSSGKSLCYNIPVLEELSQNLSSCALYLFPTKALAQDQIRTLSVMTEGVDMSINIGVYDGDTFQEDRIWLRDNARLLITNPDMLHISILPFHAQFDRILSNLRYVVIDEAHTYKGAFGCHTALILRRLRRLCSHVYGSDPSFIFSTATSANPCEHAMELAGLSTLKMIKNDGSPSGPKLFALWNPPQRLIVSDASNRMKNYKIADTEVVSRRSSPVLEVSRLFAEMVQHSLRCIAFCKTRKLCEIVLSYAREILQKSAPHLVDSICAYRAGYTPEDRRRIESEFFGGKLCGVAATNALELGIDVGHIDATLHLGFPGSISSLWQQAGRSGRRERPSLAVYVAFEGPLDQYFMKFPEKLFKSPIECFHIDAQNKQVLEQHLLCASAEHPLSLIYDEKYFGSGLSTAVSVLTNKGYLTSDPSRNSSARIWCYIGHEKRPSYGIGIRAIESAKYKVIDEKRNEVIEEIEESKVFFQVYEGAVYLHQGKTHLIKKLDLSAKTALCQEADVKYYTKTRDYTDIHVIGGDIAYPAKFSETRFSRTTAQAHNCEITTTWFGFHRIYRGTNRILDTVELSLPKYTYQSQAVWIRVLQTTKAAVETRNFSFRSGLHAAGHALLNVVPLFIRCNNSDLASECANPHETRYFPERILLYDRHPGGSGISAQVQPLFRELLTAALDLLKTCYCSGDAGCPNCVQVLSCQEYNEVLHKDAAIMILQGVVDAEELHFRKWSESSETEDQ